MDLKNLLEQISQKRNYKLVEHRPGLYSLDVAIPLKDGKWRYQYVYISVETPQNGGRQRIFMNSRAGRYNQMLNHYLLMKEATYCNYSCITISNDKDKDGNPIETVFVQSAPYLDTTSVELLDDIVYEVANNADILEEKFFGGDSN